jgi:Mn-dependent DtxR family transcriptional regulator
MAQDQIAYRDAITGVLKRQDANGLPHISEAEIGREIGADAHQVADALRQMAKEGAVARTGDGNWELTPAQATRTEPRPDPKEPRQA